MFETMTMYLFDAPKMTTLRVHFTILNHKPAILARGLMVFSLSDDLSQSTVISAMDSFPHITLSTEQRSHFTKTVSTIACLFVAQVMPGCV